MRAAHDGQPRRRTRRVIAAVFFIAAILCVVLSVSFVGPANTAQYLRPPKGLVAIRSHELVVRNTVLFISSQERFATIAANQSEPISLMNVRDWTIPTLTFRWPRGRIDRSLRDQVPRPWVFTLPLLPMSLGLVLAGILTLWVRRQRPGHCPCGYSLAGLAHANNLVTCPECGATHTPLASSPSQPDPTTHHA